MFDICFKTRIIASFYHSLLFVSPQHVKQKLLPWVVVKYDFDKWIKSLGKPCCSSLQTTYYSHRRKEGRKVLFLPHFLYIRTFILRYFLNFFQYIPDSFFPPFLLSSHFPSFFHSVFICFLIGSFLLSCFPSPSVLH